MNALTPTKTFFACTQPSNLLTVAEFRTFAKKVLFSNDWKKAVSFMKDRNGGVLVLKADGSLHVYEVGRKMAAFKPNTWGWEKDRVED